MAQETVGSSKPLSERLLAMLDGEIARLEREIKDNNPKKSSGKLPTARSEPADCGGAAPASSGRPAGRKTAGGTKERIEAIGQLTRTLEKLLELKRLERLAAGGGEAADDAETAKLRAEMMKRLRALDARRRTGPSLFGPGDRADAAFGSPRSEQGVG